MNKFETKPTESTEIAPLTESEKQKWEIINKDIPPLARQLAEEETGKRWGDRGLADEKELNRSGDTFSVAKQIESELKEIFTKYKEMVNSAEDLKQLYENRHK